MGYAVIFNYRSVFSSLMFCTIHLNILLSQSHPLFWVEEGKQCSDRNLQPSQCCCRLPAFRPSGMQPEGKETCLSWIWTRSNQIVENLLVLLCHANHMSHLCPHVWFIDMVCVLLHTPENFSYTRVGSIIIMKFYVWSGERALVTACMTLSVYWVMLLK